MLTEGTDEILMKNMKRSIPFIFKLLGCLFIFVVLFVLSQIYGAADATAKDVWLAIASDEVSDSILVIRELRLPREVAGILVGAALAVAGTIMQGVTRNPLADPGLLGLSSGASMALALILAFAPGVGTFGIMLACFLGAALGASLVLLLSAMRRGQLSPTRIILAGAAVSAFLYAVSEAVGLYFKISKDVSMWTAGGLIGTTWDQVQAISPVIIIGVVIATLLSKQLTIMSLSDDVAVSLGQRLVLIKALLFVVVIVLTGASVALVGNIAFVGLMIPHIVRTFAGTDYRAIMPLSAITGASFMLLADTMGRTIHAPYETPVAAIVAMMGLPFFLFVVNKGGGKRS